MKKGKGIRSLIGLLLIIMLVTLVACNNNSSNVNYNDENNNTQINQQVNQGNEDINNAKDDSNTNVNDSGNEVKGNKIKKIDGIKMVGDIEVSNIQIELIEEGRCRVTADVKNTSDNDLPPTNVSLKVINQSGDKEKVFGGIITELIWHEENQFVTYVWSDITDAYDIEIVKNDI